MTNKLLVSFFILFIYGCAKDISVPVPETITIVSTYNKYTISKGQHYCDKNNYRHFYNSLMAFKVKFDSSAIYQSVIPVNQFDVNKLYGFSEGFNHHLNSARIGWAWNKNALRLYAYAYCDSTRSIKEITEVEIGAELSCTIGIEESTYSFTVNERTVSLSRGPSGMPLEGYWLYPYFGGDEVAPHDVTIDIMDVKE